MTKLNIFIRLYIRSTISLEVEPSDNIECLKNRVEYLEELPKSYQRFIYNGIELENRNTVGYYNLKNDCMIICETSELLVTTPKEDVLTFHISRDDTAETIKEKIEKSTGVPKHSQQLFYDCCSFKGKQLDDYKTIAKNEINGHLIHMKQIFPGMQVFVEVLRSTRSLLNIKCQATDRIGKIKAKLEKQTALPKDTQTIFYLDNELEDNETLEYYNIQNKAVLQVTEGKKIFIRRLSGSNFSLNAEKSYSVENIKRKIEGEQGIPKKLQKLYCHGQSLEDSKTLANYEISFGMKIELHAGLCITIISQLKPKLTLDILPTSKILEVKTEIKKRLGFPINSQDLKFNGVDLDSKKTLKYYNIKDYSYINLFIKTGKNLELTLLKEDIEVYLKAQHSDKIHDLKSRAAKMINCSLEDYYLSYREIYLQEEKNISFYGIENYSTLLLIRRRVDDLCLFVKTPSGKTVRFYSVHKNDSIEHLKQRLENFDGTPVDSIRLIFAGQQLEDGKCISDYEIKNESTLHQVLRLRGC